MRKDEKDPDPGRQPPPDALAETHEVFNQPGVLKNYEDRNYGTLPRGMDVKAIIHRGKPLIKAGIGSNLDY